MFILEPYPKYNPSKKLIASVTRDINALVTTTTEHLFNTGLIVRLLVPEACGMFQINQMTAEIIVVDAFSFTTGINSTNFDAFLIPPYLPTPGGVPQHYNTLAEVIPIGEGNEFMNSYPININKQTERLNYRNQ